MGNTHSTESLQQSQTHGGSTTSKRSTHKLSKPKVGNHASPTPSSQPAGLLSVHGRAVSSSLPPSRSNSHVASQRLSSAHSQVSASSGPQPGAAVPSSIPTSAKEPEVRPAKDWKRRTSLFRSKSSYEPRKERESMMLAPPLPVRMSRANSMTWETQKEMDNSRQLQVESWHIPGNRQSINYNLMSYESRRLLNLSEHLAACEEDSIMSESKFESKFEVSPTTWKSSHPHQPAAANVASTHIPRAISDVSLYAPVRRRSMIQTPGLATRMPTEYSASRRSSLRHSVPATPAGGPSRLNSIESSTVPIPALAEFVSEPDFLLQPATEPVERALTPSEMDYRPLGAMKFGSLRIMNGAASPLPSPDFEPQAIAEMREEVGDEKRSVFGNESDGWGSGDKDVKITVSTIQPISAPRVLGPIKTSFLQVGSQRQRSNSPLSPELKIASKHTAMEDELFEDDVEMDYSTEVLTVRNDPNAKPSLERLQADQFQKHSGTIFRADSGIVASPTTENQPKPLSKADSGYSSNVSLRSFHAKQPAGGKQHQHRRSASYDSGDELSDSVASPNAVVSNEGPNAGSYNADDLAIRALGSATSPSPVHPKDYFLTSPTSSMTFSPKLFFNLNVGHTFRKDRKAPVAIDNAKAAGNGPTSPESAQSTGASSDKPSGLFPMPTRRLSLRAQESKDTLLTILSAGSVDAGHAEDERDTVLPIDSYQVVSESTADARGTTEIPLTPRRHTFQAVPAPVAVQATASTRSRSKSRSSTQRKPLPSAVKDTAETFAEVGATEMQDGLKPIISPIDLVGESVGKSAFDQAFMAMPRQEQLDVRDERTLTMSAQMEREMEMRFYSTEPLPFTDPFPIMGPLASTGRQHEPSVSAPKPPTTRKTSPPVSMHTRSAKNTRTSVQTRPKTASSERSQPRRQTLSRHSSRETIHSYPSTSNTTLDDALSVPPLPPMHPHRPVTMHEQQYAMRRVAAEDKWHPTNHCGTEFDLSARPAMRSVSTVSSGPHHQQLRHRSSYDSYSQHHGPVARGHPSVSQSPSQSGSYYQQQLLKIQQQQWEQREYESPDAVQPGLARSRSRSRSVHAHGNTPYRVLHSYNSPAYRNVPIWG